MRYMLYKKCACGCGKWFESKKDNHNYYDNNHRRRHLYALKTGKASKKDEPSAKKPEEMTPEERYEALNLSQVEAEGLRLHRTYGELQTAYYNKNLPEDFGLEILKGETK